MQTEDFNYLNITTRKIEQRIDKRNHLSWITNGKVITKLGNEYLDPDVSSTELYQSLFEQYEHKQLKSGNYLSLTLDKCQVNATITDEFGKLIFTAELTSDYIGPSKNWANSTRRKESPKFTLREISDFLLDARKLGGHILLPKKLAIPGVGLMSGCTINQRRGGASGLYDRFDLTLLDIKNWYAKRECYLLTSCTIYRLWLEQLVDFAGFIEFYQLEDFVTIVDGDYLIKNLWPNERVSTEYFTNEFAGQLKDIPKEHDAYWEYVNNSCELILKRNARIFEQLDHLANS